MTTDTIRRNETSDKAGNYGLNAAAADGPAADASNATDSKNGQARPVSQDGVETLAFAALPDLSDEQIMRVLRVLEIDEELPRETAKGFERGDSHILPLPTVPALTDTTPIPEGEEDQPFESSADLAPTSGGVSSYSADFGALIAGLQATTGGTAVTDTAVSDLAFELTDLNDDSTIFLPGASIAAEDAATLLPSDGEDADDGDADDEDDEDDDDEDDADDDDDEDEGDEDADDDEDDGANDDLQGGNGNDTLSGGLGDDTLSGGNGKDSLDGGAGNDDLQGGNGNDTLIGGLGDDTLTGGNGKDVFAFSLAEDEGHDTIPDFKAGKGGDTLRLSDLTDLNGDGTIDIDDLDAGGHSVTGTADSVVVSFDSGSVVTLAGLDGSGVNSFADLQNMNVSLEIV